jgi:hypothetical protein
VQVSRLIDPDWLVALELDTYVLDNTRTPAAPRGSEHPVAPRVSRERRLIGARPHSETRAGDGRVVASLGSWPAQQRRVAALGRTNRWVILKARATVLQTGGRRDGPAVRRIEKGTVTQMVTQPRGGEFSRHARQW